uniref:Uncharacterized protein n=1 Tax=Nelumbo nucifera TaxID=4432 RepID=A0A822YS58_NELNU|nr:TPA_asm: hypothetical protein HUJ06_007645 [Nelumbo nucifera]
MIPYFSYMASIPLLMTVFLVEFLCMDCFFLCFQFSNDDLVFFCSQNLVVCITWTGEIVGVFTFSGDLYQESSSMVNVKFTSQPSFRRMEEVAGSTNSTTTAEVLLVRWSLAWITGIILLISTLLGIHFLLNMPLTRDTLLYSNVKLD